MPLCRSLRPIAGLIEVANEEGIERREGVPNLQRTRYRHHWNG